ncbi:DUF309 domain-containing protein [Mycobacterium sp. 1274756.6]|uniref:DUF309 domain-containing protein n=1 Tax=Mycobacterium sp. 1274756.6 TaxID=1834076 RepID=UPI000800C898|nr:DUF309 domain-containing protein [Mycobacterium sp. 1274756.6]OBJ71025.1 hypothetical protein A5643_09060 [Mycobacterium sp. 1274756.6]
MAQRDRDEDGRPRNARPRDALGRPLPRGSAGVPGIPEDLELPPAETLDYAQRLLDEGRAFHAHEVLEAAWKTGPPGERELWQGLAQLAVGITHVQRGNPVGAAALLERAAERLRRVGTARHGVDIVGLLGFADVLGEAVAAGDPVGPEALRPRLTTR